MTTRHDYSVIPTRTVESLMWYLYMGRRPGQFLSAVLRGDLDEAVSRGDDENLAALVQLTCLIHARVPGIARSRPDEWIMLPQADRENLMKVYEGGPVSKPVVFGTLVGVVASFVGTALARIQSTTSYPQSVYVSKSNLNGASVGDTVEILKGERGEWRVSRRLS